VETDFFQKWADVTQKKPLNNSGNNHAVYSGNISALPNELLRRCRKTQQHTVRQ